MAAIGHLPFVLTSTPSSMCQSVGRSLFHTSLDSQYDSGLSLNAIHNSISSNETTNNPTPSPGQDIVCHLQEAVSLCKMYIKELINVCNAGVQTAQHLTTSIKDVAKLAEQDPSCASSRILSQKLADDYFEVWNQLSVTMKSSVDILQKGVFAAVQDVVANLDKKDKNLSYNLPIFASESNKVLITSLLTMIHLQFEFSVCMCEALFDLMNFNPEYFNLNSVLVHDSSKTSSDKLSEFVTSCLDSLSGLQRHFSESFSSLRRPSSFQPSAEIENSPFPPKARPSSSPEIPFQKYLYSSIEKFPFDGTWSALPDELMTGNVLNKPKHLDSQLPPSHIPPLPYIKSSSNRSQTIWSMDSLPESPWASLEKSAEAFKTMTKEEKQKSVFASHKELQDIIGLLSCQTSNPSSPTSESSATSHYQATNEAKTSFLWPLPNGNSNGPLNYDSEIGFRGVPNAELYKHSQSWPRENDLSSVWNSPTIQESSMCNIKTAYNPMTEVLFDQLSHPVENSELMQLYKNLNGERISALNGNRCQHLRASKSTSWPVKGSHSQSSSDDQDETSSSKLPDKGNHFFMGIQLVGKDLMASVRQRRHSSGSSFPENMNFQTYSPSLRTKSIDSILMENACKETSSSKPDAPGQPTSLPSSSGNEAAMSNGSSLWHVGNLPQGLPPSGVEKRQKFKIERKYSLFGQVV